MWPPKVFYVCAGKSYMCICNDLYRFWDISQCLYREAIFAQTAMHLLCREPAGIVYRAASGYATTLYIVMGWFQGFYFCLVLARLEKTNTSCGVWEHLGAYFHMGTQNGSKLDFWLGGLLIDTFELKMLIKMCWPLTISLVLASSAFPQRWIYCITSTRKRLETFTVFMCSRGICIEPMGCEISDDWPHAHTKECNNVYVLCTLCS